MDRDTNADRQTQTHRYTQILTTDTVVNESATEATTGIWTDLQILREILKGRRTDV